MFIYLFRKLKWIIKFKNKSYFDHVHKKYSMSCSQGSVKPDNETSETEIEEKELEILKDDDSPEKPSSEVC